MASHPLALIAEITHRCPLHCVYCSNPLELTSRKEELATTDWLRVAILLQLTFRHYRAL